MNSSCSSDSFGQPPPGVSNISSDAGLLDWYHLSIYSPCRGAGSALYAGGTDLDGEPWNNPPSMGCDEVVVSNRAGPLSVNLTGYVIAWPPQTILDLAAGQFANFTGTVTGSAAYLGWNFGDGPSVTNAGSLSFHQWFSLGQFTVVFTAYNADNPDGVSASLVARVVANAPQLQAASVQSNIVQFQFKQQAGANYTVQYATDLTPPVAWLTLSNFYSGTSGVYQIQDFAATNATRFYRVLAQ